VTEHRYAFVEPGRDRRRQGDHLKKLLKTAPGRDRAVELARLSRGFHATRELNQAMETARRALQDAGGDVEVLVDAYREALRPDVQLDDLSNLVSLARWLLHDGLSVAARAAALEVATSWCATADGRERERRLDVVRRRFDDDLADAVDLALA
jgi:hypothetical protein